MVSVVMPVFNAAPFLARAINSVLQQSFDDFELLIIDDGSTDGSGEILSAFVDPRIRRFRHEKNLGISVTMNHGLEQAGGRYMAVMDADDVCCEDRISTQVDFLERHPEVVACGMEVEARSPDGRTVRWRYPQQHDEIAAGFLFNCSVAHPTLMLRLAFLRDYQLCYDETLKRAQDYALLARIARLGRIHNINKVGCIYSLHGTGKSPDWQSHTRQTAASIRAAARGLLQLPPMNSDAQLHEFIATAGAAGGAYTLPEIKAWLDRVSVANRANPVWAPQALDALLCKQYFSLSHALSCPLSLVWREFSAAAFSPDMLSRLWRFGRFSSERLELRLRGLLKQ